MRTNPSWMLGTLLLSVVMPACDRASEPEPLTGAGAALGTALASYYVVLEGAPAVESIPPGDAPASARAASATRQRLTELEAEHATFKPSLVQHGATIVGELSRLGNAIQILATHADAKRIERLAGVLRVEPVPLVEPAMASALPVVGAPAVWALSAPIQGDGITIGIVDTGIDYTHADFAGAGTAAAYLANDSTLIEPGSFPTTKVVGGWDFVGDDYDASSPSSVPVPDPDPLDCTKPESSMISGGHGSHVAGIAAGTGVAKDGTSFAGPYQASFDPAAFRIAPGVAPNAKLYALKVFGCDGATAMLGAALERAADPNQDGVFDDRLDVVNASLGTSYALGTSLTAELAENLAKLGTVVVAAAGNEGQSFFTTSSPGSIPSVLSVAASIDNEFLSLSVTAPPSAVAKYPAAEGGFTLRLIDVGPVSGEVVMASPADGCGPLSNAAQVAGKLALIDRGVCPFVDKFQNALAAGAIAGVVVDNTDDPLPFAMGGGDPGTVALPGVMIRQADGDAIKTALATAPVSLALDPQDLYVGAGSELLAGFSARGPSPSDRRLKPEIAAPGFSIDSARVGSGTEPRRSQGTSMASPVVAGAAALVRQARPTWSAHEIKAALINSTETLKGMDGLPYGATIVGSGRLAVERAVAQEVTAAADPLTGEVGVSFGAIVTDQTADVKRSVVVTNHGAAAATLDAKVEPTFELPGVTLAASPAALVVPPGESASVELTLTLDPALLGSPGPDPGTSPIQSQQARHYLNEANGRLRLTHSAGGAEDVLVPYHGSVRAAARRQGVAPSACGPARGAPSNPVAIAVTGASAHPEPVVTAFQLGLLDPVLDGSDTDPQKALIDVRAIGAATNLSTAASFDEAEVYFGIAITGTWTTPARGPLSVVSVQIDSDQNGSADFEVRAEARNRDGPFRDALTAATYQSGYDQRISRRPLNLVTPDVAQTHPFESSVLVLSALLSEVGVSETNPVFDYSVATESPDYLTLGEHTIWATFDAGKPALDPAKPGSDGLPLYQGDVPVLVDVLPEARAAQTPLDLLLLHHTNVPGEQWEVVNLGAGLGNLALEAAAPQELETSATGTITLTVTNPSTVAAPSVALTAAVTAGELISAQASQGSCTAEPTSSCALGELPAGASATIAVTVRAGASAGTLVLDASVDSALACESTLTDNTAQASLAVTAPSVPTVPPGPTPVALHPVGGCGCRAGAEGSPTRALWALACLALLAARRRR